MSGARTLYKGLLGLIILALATSALALATPISDAYSLYQNGKSGTYLLLFLNNSEIRPGGGFIGSFARVRLVNGAITDLAVETNIYKRDNAFIAQNDIEPPEPLRRVNHAGRWALHDANWYPDFADSAQHVKWFYDRSSTEKETINGVIGVTLTAAEELIKLTGPITVPEHSLTLTNENFFSEIQYRVEKGYFATEENKSINEPKTVIRDMIPPLAQKLKEINPVALTGYVSRMAREKQIIFWFNDTQNQARVEKWNWGGRIPTDPRALFGTVNAALDQAKSTRSIRQHTDITEKTAGAGRYTDVRITRTHVGSYTWPDGDDANYLQLIVPSDAKVEAVSVDGIDIMKTPFVLETNPQGFPIIQKVTSSVRYSQKLIGFWADTAVGESTVIELSYTAAASLNSKTRVIKQIGATNETVRLIRDDRVIFDGALEADFER
jgi:hypothetical protein